MTLLGVAGLVTGVLLVLSFFSSVARRVTGVLLIIGGAILGAYLTVWVMFFGGVIELINGAKANPTNTHDVVWGIIRGFFFSTAVGGFAFAVCAVIGAIFLGWGVIGWLQKKAMKRAERKLESMLG